MEGTQPTGHSLDETAAVASKLKYLIDQRKLDAAQKQLTREKKVSKNMTLKQCKLGYTDAGTMIVEIPPYGMGLTHAAIGACSAYCLSFAGGMLLEGGGGMALAPIAPIAGVMLAKMAFFDPFVSSRLTLGEYVWSLEKRFFGMYFQKVQGLTAEVVGAMIHGFRMPLFTSSSVFQMEIRTKLNATAKLGLSRFDTRN